MSNSDGISVRMDFYKNGDMAPISFVDSSKSTHYIRKILKIVRESNSLYTDIVHFLCITRTNDTVVLSLINGRWYKER